MKRPLKILLVIVLLLVVAWVIYVVAQRPTPPVSGPIVLQDGSWVRIEAVTYGTNHLVGPRLAYVADRMPQSIRTLMVRFLGRPAAMRFSHTTSSPKLVLWLNRGISATPFPTNTGYFECVLSDTNGFTCGDAVPFAARYPLTVTEFDVFPRREAEIILSIYFHDATGAVFKRGSTAFATPLYRRYPEWKPEPLPVTKRAGDVEVTLEKLSTGHSDRSEYKPRLEGGKEIVLGTNRLDGGNMSVAALRLKPLMDTNEVWDAVNMFTSDATGNRIHSATRSHYANGFITWSPALWPGETWKLELELKRRAGFKPEELVTFRDVPLGALNATNRVGWTTNCNGVSVTVEYLIRGGWRSVTMDLPSQIHLRLSGLTNDMHLDLLSARTDMGANFTSSSHNISTDSRTYFFRDIPTDATTADFTFAVQRSRSVEFLVKPETGTLRLEVAPKIKP